MTPPRLVFDVAEFRRPRRRLLTPELRLLLAVMLCAAALHAAGVFGFSGRGAVAAHAMLVSGLSAYVGSHSRIAAAAAAALWIAPSLLLPRPDDMTNAFYLLTLLTLSTGVLTALAANAVAPRSPERGTLNATGMIVSCTLLAGALAAAAPLAVLGQIQPEQIADYYQRVRATLP